MGKKEKAHRKKVAVRNAKFVKESENAFFSERFTQVFGLPVKEGYCPQTWEHLLHLLNIPEVNADISIYGNINSTKDGKKLNSTYIKTAGDKFKIFLNPTGFSSYIYRGEHKKYEHFKPTLQRALCKGETDKVQTKEDFVAALKESPIYTYFRQPVKWGDESLTFDIDAEAIAQHYGFVSNYFDLTRDEDVAKFFAYTYVDKKTGEYKLIEDFKDYSPTLYRAHISDIYKKYGCEPIGFQPFLRPINQWALAVNLGDNYKDAKGLFETFELSDSVEAKRIYDKFKGGKLLFPKEPITDFIDKYSPNFTAAMEWDAGYVKFLLNWLSENIGWRGESPHISKPTYLSI
jgi:hypothetical protein